MAMEHSPDKRIIADIIADAQEQTRKSSKQHQNATIKLALKFGIELKETVAQATGKTKKVPINNDILFDQVAAKLESDSQKFWEVYAACQKPAKRAQKEQKEQLEFIVQQHINTIMQSPEEEVNVRVRGDLEDDSRRFSVSMGIDEDDEHTVEIMPKLKAFLYTHAGNPGFQSFLNSYLAYQKPEFISATLNDQPELFWNAYEANKDNEETRNTLNAIIEQVYTIPDRRVLALPAEQQENNTLQTLDEHIASIKKILSSGGKGLCEYLCQNREESKKRLAVLIEHHPQDFWKYYASLPAAQQKQLQSAIYNHFIEAFIEASASSLEEKSFFSLYQSISTAIQDHACDEKTKKAIDGFVSAHLSQMESLSASALDHSKAIGLINKSSLELEKKRKKIAEEIAKLVREDYLTELQQQELVNLNAQLKALDGEIQNKASEIEHLNTPLPLSKRMSILLEAFTDMYFLDSDIFRKKLTSSKYPQLIKLGSKLLSMDLSSSRAPIISSACIERAFTEGGMEKMLQLPTSLHTIKGPGRKKNKGNSIRTREHPVSSYMKAFFSSTRDDREGKERELLKLETAPAQRKQLMRAIIRFGDYLRTSISSCLDELANDNNPLAFDKLLSITKGLTKMLKEAGPLTLSRNVELQNLAIDNLNILKALQVKLSKDLITAISEDSGQIKDIQAKLTRVRSAEKGLMELRTAKFRACCVEHKMGKRRNHPLKFNENSPFFLDREHYSLIEHSSFRAEQGAESAGGFIKLMEVHLTLIEKALEKYEPQSKTDRLQEEGDNALFAEILVRANRQDTQERVKEGENGIPKYSEMSKVDLQALKGKFTKALEEYKANYKEKMLNGHEPIPRKMQLPIAAPSL